MRPAVLRGRQSYRPAVLQPALLASSNGGALTFGASTGAVASSSCGTTEKERWWRCRRLPPVCSLPCLSLSLSHRPRAAPSLLHFGGGRRSRKGSGGAASGTKEMINPVISTYSSSLWSCSPVLIALTSMLSIALIIEVASASKAPLQQVMRK